MKHRIFKRILTLALAMMLLIMSLPLSGVDAVEKSSAPENLALNKSYSSYNNLIGYPAQNAFDKNQDTFWAPPGGYNVTIGPELSPSTDIPSYLQIDLGSTMQFNRVVVKEKIFDGAIRLNEIQVQTACEEQAWTTQDAATASATGVTTFDFEQDISARYVRIYLASIKGIAAPGISEVEIYSVEEEMLPSIPEMERSIVQRNEANQADIVIEDYASNVDGIVEARLVSDDGQTVADWVSLQNGDCTFQNVPAGGWYTLEMRAKDGNEIVATKTVVEKIGVGDVFIVSGQSNSACFGTEKTTAQYDTVSTYHAGERMWYPCKDIQPSISAFNAFTDRNGGSPWPTMGDYLTEKLQVPIGFVLTGYGGAQISNYDPQTGAYYSYIKTAIEGLKDTGFKAILWHQGESDAIVGTTTEVYAAELNKIIEATRKDAGFDVPWIIANVGYHPDSNATQERQQAIRIAQQQVCEDEEDQTYLGPDTDRMGKKYRDPIDLVHFNLKGLIYHGKMWAAAVLDYLEKEEADATSLQNTINVIEALHESDYTETSWEAMQMAVQEAKLLLQGQYTNIELIYAEHALDNAMQNLFPRGEVYVDDRDSEIVYSSGWNLWSEDGHYQSTITFSNTVGSSMEYAFEGEAIEVYGQKTFNCPYVEVYLDGEKHGEADMYSSAALGENQALIYRIDGIPAGRHVLKVVVSDKKNPSACPNGQNIQVALDFLKVIGASTGDPGDKTSLQTLYQAGLNKNEDAYTVGSWATFQTAMENAKAVLDNADATQAEVNEAAAALQSAVDGLVNLSTLEYVLNIANGHVETGDVDKLVPSAQEVFNKVLASAQAIYDDTNATQEQVDAAWKTLMYAIQAMGFVPGDKTELIDLVAEAKALDLNGYEDGAEKNAFTAALKAAEDLIADPDAMELDINAAYDALSDTMQNLIPKPTAGDKTELKKVIDEAEVKNSELDRYVDDVEAKQKFADALAAAKEVYEKDGATQDEIDQARNDLIDAMTGLRLRADKENLNKWLEDLKSIDLSQYTEESAAVVRAVIAKAEALATQDLDEDGQDLINAMVAEMAIARVQLVPAPTDPEDPEDPNPGDGSGESSNPESSKPNGDASSQSETNSEGKEATDEVPTTGDSVPVAAMSFLAVAAASTVLLMKKHKKK